MKWAPCASTPHAAVLPVFDPTWKDKCLACGNLTARPRNVGTRKEHTMMHCAAIKGHDERGKYARTNCIDARSEGGPCGEQAVLFVPKPLR